MRWKLRADRSSTHSGLGVVNLKGGKAGREERLVKALRDNLRRRKASSRDEPAKATAGKGDAPLAPKRPPGSKHKS
jgi:hypothetical protein